jgi:Ni,Fe-hydrogenase maturation factor
VADLLEKSAPAGVDIRRIHQLTPEWAEVVAQTALTLIVDAAEGKRMSLRRIRPRASAALSHYLTAETLAGLAQRLYGSSPEVYLLTIPGVSFGLSEKMSAAAEHRVRRAARRVLAFLESPHA